MYYGNIKKYDIADGEGVRVTLFVSGCTNHCLNCFQPETWDFNYGKPYTKETEDEIITLKTHSEVKQIVVYLHQNNLQEIIRKNFPLINEQEYSLPKNDDTLNYLLGWSGDIQSFYENAQKEGCSVIFTVDL